MPEIYVTVPGVGTYPPLPTTGTGTGAPGPGGGEAIDAFPAYKPPAGPAQPGMGASGQEAADAFPEYKPQQAPVAPGREIGTGEAVARGAIKGATFGLAPAIAGVAGASGIDLPQPQMTTLPSGEQAVMSDPLKAMEFMAKVIAMLPVGAYKLATGGKDIVDAYHKARAEALKTQEEAQKQHPYAFIGGELGGALATPAVPLRAATTLGRVGKSALGGAVGGGLFAGGEATSEAQSPLDVAKQTAGGAVTGGIAGGALGSAVDTLTGLGRAAQRIYRGHSNPQAQAERIVGQGAREGARAGADLAADPLALQMGRQVGTPLRLVDVAGQPGRSRLSDAAVQSPEARALIERNLRPVQQQQFDRIGGWIRNRFGAHDTAADVEALQHAARMANKPAYDRAYAVAEHLHPRGMDSPVLQHLMSSDAVPAAMQLAATKGRNRLVAEGQGAFNPAARIDPNTQQIVFQGRGGGLQAYPDLRFWDLTQRHLREMANNADRQGLNEQAGAIYTLHRQLLNELDRLTTVRGTSAFGQARGIAAHFFGAENALQAGENFVRDTGLQNREAARVIARMAPAERELFARGYASELANQLEKLRFNQNILNSVFVDSPRAVERTRLALGPQGAAEFEALIRIERIADLPREVLGGSPTAKRLSEAGLATGAGVASEIARNLNPVHILTAAILLGSREAAQRANNEVATRVAEMMLSQDPAVFQRVVQISAHTPWIRESLRHINDATIRQAMDALGPGGVGAAELTFGRSLYPAAQEPHREQYQQQERHRLQTEE